MSEKALFLSGESETPSAIAQSENPIAALVRTDGLKDHPLQLESIDVLIDLSRLIYKKRHSLLQS